MSMSAYLASRESRGKSTPGPDRDGGEDGLLSKLVGGIYDPLREFRL